MNYLNKKDYITRIADAIEKIQEDNGYYDSEGVWHEFGGGAVNITPTLAITVVNSTAEGYEINPNDNSLMKIENNNLIRYGGVSLTVRNGETKVIETIIPKTFGNFSFPSSQFYYPDGVTYSVSNLVNCSIINEFITITDPSQNASCTLTFTLSE